MILTDNTSTASATRGFHIIKATSNDAYIYNYENTAMVFGTNSAERLRITSTGNVGIGTATNINNKLVVHQNTGTGGVAGVTCFPLRISAGAFDDVTYTTGTFIGLATEHASTTWSKCGIGHVRTGSFDRGSIVFLCNNVENTNSCTMSDERMRITSTGNVVIGGNVNVGSSTNAILHVYGSDPNSVIGCFKHPNNSQGIGIGWDTIFALGNGSATVGTGNQSIRLVPLGTGVVNVQGNLTATGTKSWIIKHPILENKDLMHVCIEGPRADNLYRGRKQLVNGECEVNLDLECNTTGGMTEGTFVLINKNIQVFVNNNETFDKVVGKVVGNKIIVECDNVNASCFIDWLVIGERNDNEIINNLNTSSSGSVIVEIDRVVQQMQENIPSTSNTSNVY